MTDRPTSRRRAGPPLAIGIDIGGSGIKGAAVDLATGAFASPRHRIPTPQPSGPAAVLPTVRHLADLIEQKRPAVGRLKEARPILSGSGKRASRVTKELALEE